jgi:hypothetical protein
MASSRKIVGNLSGVYDRWTGSDERLQVLHDGHALSQGLFRLLAVGDIRPGPDELQRTTRVIMDDPESILDPNIGPVPMPEAVF